MALKHSGTGSLHAGGQLTCRILVHNSTGEHLTLKPYTLIKQRALSGQAAPSYNAICKGLQRSRALGASAHRYTAIGLRTPEKQKYSSLSGQFCDNCVLMSWVVRKQLVV